MSDLERELRYAELEAIVDRVAAAIAVTAGDRPGPVAVLLPNDVRVAATLLGVFATGRCYLPLDPDSPVERNRLIATHAGPAVAISTGGLARQASVVFAPDCPTLDLDNLENIATDAGISRPGPDSLACIIYTSGSTGRPKGAYHNHRNLLHDTMQQTNALHVNEEDRLALFFPPTIITAIRETLTALLNGAALYILPPQTLQPAGIIRQIRECRITICRMVPVLLRRIAETLRPDERLDSVRIVGLGGQRVAWSDFDIFAHHFSPKAHLFVGMGSTESGGNFCRWFVDGRLRAEAPRLPVGWTLPDAKVMIVDADGRPAASGEVGELVVVSRYIALGYWRDEELTRKAFSVDPADPEMRIFRTGDLGQMRPDGLLDFIGRDDQQIKLRGHRIELPEIEAALARCAGVADAAVIVRLSEAGVPQSLTAYVEPVPAATKLLPRDLRAALSHRLPQYMLPASLHIVERLPRLPNLKVDRTRLVELDTIRRAQISIAADDPLVAELIEIFGTVLGPVSPTSEDNILSLGGDSLQAVRLALELERRFEVAIPPTVLESTQTIRELAAWLAAQETPTDRPSATTDTTRNTFRDAR